VQRRREAVLDHVLRIERRERGMQLLEFVEVVEHRLHDRVDRVGGVLVEDTNVASTPYVFVSCGLFGYRPAGMLAYA
jgi:hypothetical protein